jgi:hypothetical protein
MMRRRPAQQRRDVRGRSRTLPHGAEVERLLRSHLMVLLELPPLQLAETPLEHTSRVGPLLLHRRPETPVGVPLTRIAPRLHASGQERGRGERREGEEGDETNLIYRGRRGEWNGNNSYGSG